MSRTDLPAKAKVSVFNEAVHKQLSNDLLSIPGLYRGPDQFFVTGQDSRAGSGHSMPEYRAQVGTVKTESYNNTLDQALPAGAYSSRARTHNPHTRTRAYARTQVRMF